MAYDPVQIGWVRADSKDDMGRDGPLSWHLSRQRTGAYRFRKWSDADASALARMLSSPQLWKYLPEQYGGRLGEDTARDLVVLSNEGEHHLVRAVELDGQVIGQVRLEFGKSDRSEAEISYWLDEACWGQGHGSEIVSRFADESFQRRPDLARLSARVHQNNPASARVLVKAGFRLCEGAGEGPWQRYERHGHE